MRKIFHLEIKSDNSHKYYGSLSALCSENPNLGISKFTLDRFDFTEPFENSTCIIRKSVMKTTGSVGKKIKKTFTNVKSKPQADVMLSLLAFQKEKIKKDLFEWIRTDMYGTHDEYIQKKINEIFASNGA